MITNKWQYVIIAILVVVLIGEVLWYSPYTGPKAGSFRVLDMVQNSEGQMTNVTIRYQLNASLPLDATVVITPVKSVPKDLPIYVFYDKNYPTVGTDWILIAMLQAHLKAELHLRGYSAEVRLEDAEYLENILSKNESAIVIMASGAFPSNIFSKEINLVKPWIKSGGILIWFGWFPGWYSVEKGQTKGEIKDDMPQNFRQDGPGQLGLEGLFEFVVLNKSSVVAEEDLPLSESLDTTYNLIHQAPLLDRIDAKNGLALGKIGGESGRLRSSISMISVGEGEIIIFGFFLMSSLVLNGPELAARDIAQILCSGILLANYNTNPWYKSYHLHGGEIIINVSELHVNSEYVGIVIYGYSSEESIGLLFYRRFIPLQTG